MNEHALTPKQPPRASPVRSELSMTLWFAPAVLIGVAVVLFGVTYALDQAAANGHFTYPGWINSGSADDGRQILTTIAAAIITVVGVVFSITILALQLASTQFGPRMLRNFIRDRGTQWTLAMFVATVGYSFLALGSISNDRQGEFVPHLSISVALALALTDLLVLIYFIHHVAISIQLNQVVAGIASDFDGSIERQFPAFGTVRRESGLSLNEVGARLRDQGTTLPAHRSGYFQAVGREKLIRLAAVNNAVISFEHRPGHFLTGGLPLATVWPPEAAPAVAQALDRLHAVGPHRTLAQDPVFAIDQMVEIALRALSPAVNDTFTGMTCIDWLSDGLCKIAAREIPDGAHRDPEGVIRVIVPVPSWERLVSGAYAKIRQAGRGMPAINIRQLTSLTRIAQYCRTAEQRRVLLEQANMIWHSAEAAVSEPSDLAQIRDCCLAVRDIATGSNVDLV